MVVGNMTSEWRQNGWKKSKRTNWLQQTKAAATDAQKKTKMMDKHWKRSTTGLQKVQDTHGLARAQNMPMNSQGSSPSKRSQKHL